MSKHPEILMPPAAAIKGTGQFVTIIYFIDPQEEVRCQNTKDKLKIHNTK